MWRDIAITNKKNIAEALLRLEQRLAHIRENLGTRELAMEFEQAHHLKKSPRTKEELRIESIETLNIASANPSF